MTVVNKRENDGNTEGKEEEEEEDGEDDDEGDDEDEEAEAEENTKEQRLIEATQLLRSATESLNFKLYTLASPANPPTTALDPAVDVTMMSNQKTVTALPTSPQRQLLRLFRN